MKKKERQAPVTSALIMYQTKDGKTKVEVRLEDETVWLTQKLMAELFQTTPQNITIHLRNIFNEGELDEGATCKDLLQVQIEGNRQVERQQRFYNLDAIISVGYRIKSHVATRFRQWATQRLREYLIKGFTLDDERLKQAGGGLYFDELLARIRDIRSSEKVFWRKVLDIYATSIDYAPDAELSRQFFAAIQNKMHWAAHGHTAAEVIHDRADASKPHMGMTTWSGERPRKTDAEIAKNYLTEKELDILNRIVSMYLDFAELQALNRRPMHMRDWLAKLDDFLKLSERDILMDTGKISHDQALEKAHAEYERYHKEKINEPSPVERRCLEAIREVKRLEESRKRGRKK
ncbi:MAG: virulence RhuM family protein [Smithellaceae bacterium]|nr:virulence RhuM family protein [Smithellaceae bacterium]